MVGFFFQKSTAWGRLGEEKNLYSNHRKGIQKKKKQKSPSG